MQLEKGVISRSQLTFLIAGFIQGALLTTAFIAKITKQDTWLVTLTGLGVSLLFALVYIALYKKFPSKTLIEIHTLLYGAYLGPLISIAYLFFIFTIMASNLRFIVDFILTYIMPETPISVLLILFTFICAWGVRSGIEVLARMSFTLVVITLGVIFLTIILLIKDMELSNFLPIFNTPLRDFIQGTHIIATVSFSEIFIFLMIFPSLNSHKKLKSSVMWGLIIGGGTFLLSTVRNTSILGITSSIMYSPSYETVRLIDLRNVITRLEVLVAIVLMNTMFLKVSLLYYATALGTAQLLRLKSYTPLVLPIGIISISFALLLFDSSVEQGNFANSIWPFVAFPFEFLLPLSSLVFAKLRGFPKQKKGASK